MFKNKLKPKTLNDILGSFYAVLDDLEDLIERNETRIGGNTEQIEILTQENVHLSAECDRAEAIQEKIKSLIY